MRALVSLRWVAIATPLPVICALIIYIGQEEFGAANCSDLCEDYAALFVKECYHPEDEQELPEEEMDNCDPGECILNFILKSVCPTQPEGHDCLFTPPIPDSVIAIQEQRLSNGDCTYTKKAYQALTPGECEWFFPGFKVRCVTQNPCDGMLTEGPRQFVGNRLFCSH